MIIVVKNKDTLVLDDFNIKCCVGKNGLNLNKREGDFSTPRGVFNLGKLYFRKDRVGIPKTRINKKIITKKLAWCDDSNSSFYNEEIYTQKKRVKERFYRRDNKYDYLITIDYNSKKIPFNGSAIFIHLTNDYEPTAGCIAIKKKDFQILLKLINLKSKIKIG